MIITSDKYQMTEINSSYYSVQMKLTIRRFNKLDIGGYKCISKNSIGDAEGNIRLYEMTLPRQKGGAASLDRAGDSRLDAAATETEEDPGEALGNQGSLREAGDGAVDSSADAGGSSTDEGGEQAAGVASTAVPHHFHPFLTVLPLLWLLMLTPHQ
ncbi:hypothetical protein B566_EDAN002904 [Ephemera danica]|nr:hypothetical protein B566_EDAN002904 [Ephemera danica]